MCEIVKKTVEWNFFNLEISIFLNLRKIHTAESFIILHVSSSVCNKKIFIKIFNGKSGMHVRNCKKKNLWNGISPTWEFPFFLIREKSTPQNFFL